MPPGLDPRWVRERGEGQIQPIQGLVIQQVEYTPGIVWATFDWYESCLAQDKQVARDEVGRHPQCIAQPGVALSALHQQVQDAQAFGFGPYLELAGKY